MEGGGDSAEQSSSAEVESQRNRMVDPMPTRWTNEKHSHYLNSVEASFVNDLNGTEHLSKSFTGWLSRIRKQNQSNLSGYNSNSIIYGQLKVQRLGRWEQVKFERAKRLVEIRHQSCLQPASHLQSASHWIQHFRSRDITKDVDISESTNENDTDIIASNQIDDNELAIQSAHLASLRHGREATSSKQLPNCSHLCHQDSVTEMSGQNFLDEESGRREKCSTSPYSRTRKILQLGGEQTSITSGN